MSFRGVAMRHVVMLTVVGLAMVLAACGQSDNSKAEKVINSEFAKNPMCTEIPIGLPVDFSKVGPDGGLGILKAKGYIAEGKITVDTFGGKSVVDTFVLTDKGKPLVQRQATVARFFSQGTCIRTGQYQVDKIEAIDFGNDVEGKPIATVRARIKFIPEEWLVDTRNSPTWSGFWKGIGNDESGPWLYPLLKSGDEFYAYGKGRKIQ